MNKPWIWIVVCVLIVLVIVLLVILLRDNNAAGESATPSPSTMAEEKPPAPSYAGKVISILGDSISTFGGYIPVEDGFNLTHRARYPQSNLLTDVNETWWMQTIAAFDAKLGINDSWAGSRVSNSIDGNSGDQGENTCMASLTRIQNLGSNGTPDVILFFGGTNDIGTYVTMGSFDPASAPTEVDLTATKWDTAADAYVAAIMRLQHFYPDAQIFALLPTYTKSYYKDERLAAYNEVFAAICQHYNVPYVDLRESGITLDYLPDGIHPNAEGMDFITNAIVSLMQSKCATPAGEHVVYSVTHNLTGASATLGYYKGVSAGKSFVETVTGDSSSVCVTMGGVDITATAYQNGVITIPTVTGDLVITATGTVKSIYADYLQQLPENVCKGLNLWNLLEHADVYYTSTGWGKLGGYNVYSVTIPVSAGDQIWATSFLAYGENGNVGGSVSGIRVTWFDENGVLNAMSPSQTYAEMTEHGYITVPDGAVAVNIPMWSGSDANELYVLNYDHNNANGACTICGE